MRFFDRINQKAEDYFPIIAVIGFILVAMLILTVGTGILVNIWG